MMMIALVTLLILPLIALMIDGTAGVLVRNKKYQFSSVPVEDFEVLVPIWGKVAYLENVEYLRQYGQRVTLCTTGDETEIFYHDLYALAREHGFRVFEDDPIRPDRRSPTQKQRATSGTIRDRLIRNALRGVRTPYVVPLDADTTTTVPLGIAVGELVARKLDVASIRLVLANPRASLLTRLQQFEYRLSMQFRFVAPWMISGACHLARTEVLRDVMNRHSLFFQGNDVELGLIAYARHYRIGHIPFEVVTAVPSSMRGWLRQRLAWAGGEFRLFIINIRFIGQHPFFWAYGTVIAILMFPLRWWFLGHPGWPLLVIAGMYILLIMYTHWKSKNSWILLLPVYTLFSSLVLTPLGIVWYFYMVAKDGTFGVIRPNRKVIV
jgi:hypothetical protein